MTTRMPVVLFVSSNGAGMGHLTRLLAYANCLDGRAQAYFHSLSQAVPIVGDYGYPYEYTPSAKGSGMPVAVWNSVFTRRMADTLRRIRPDAVVFDGTWPYVGIKDLREAFPKVRWIWSRRGMWREGKAGDQIAKSAWFDAVVEPGDFSFPYDKGATAGAVSTRVGPVTMVGRSDLLSEKDARLRLGLSEQDRWALLSLGAGNVNDTQSVLQTFVTTLAELGVRCATAVPEISLRVGEQTPLQSVSVYPLAPLYPAFDLVVSASGYNSFHELLRLGVPTLFVPNEATSLDDQQRRAQYAADQGWAHTTASLDPLHLHSLLAELLDEGQNMVNRVQNVDPGDGAEQVVQVIMDVIST